MAVDGLYAVLRSRAVDSRAWSKDAGARRLIRTQIAV